MYATVNNISRGILGTIKESSTGMAAKSQKEKLITTEEIKNAIFL